MHTATKQTLNGRRGCAKHMFVASRQQACFPHNAKMQLTLSVLPLAWGCIGNSFLHPCFYPSSPAVLTFCCCVCLLSNTPSAQWAKVPKNQIYSCHVSTTTLSASCLCAPGSCVFHYKVLSSRHELFRCLLYIKRLCIFMVKAFTHFSSFNLP